MLFKEYNLYVAGDEGYHECRIPALLATSKGTILAFNEARKFTGRDADQIALFLRRSFDGGKSFDEVQVVVNQEGWTCGNPAPVQDRKTGTIWLPFCKNLVHDRSKHAPRTVWVTHSDDDGETWSEPEEITASVKRPDWGSGYATGPGHAIQLQSGRMVIPCNHSELCGRSHVIYSDDHGESWKIGGSADMYTSESTVLETADGWLYINCRNQYLRKKGISYFRRVAWSNDGGESFSPSVRDAGLPEPICEGSVCRYTLEEDAGKNRVLFSNPGNEKEGERHHLTVRLSYDECRTWPVSKVIYEGPSSYSDMCIAQDGTICCLYEKGQEKGVSTYSGDITFARFDLEWLTDGKDSL